MSLTPKQKIGIGLIGATGVLLIIVGAATSMYTELMILGAILVAVAVGGALLYYFYRKQKGDVAAGQDNYKDQVYEYIKSREPNIFAFLEITQSEAKKVCDIERGPNEYGVQYVHDRTLIDIYYIPGNQPLPLFVKSGWKGFNFDNDRIRVDTLVLPAWIKDEEFEEKCQEKMLRSNVTYEVAAVRIILEENSALSRIRSPV
jgi:hypothetical protein